MKQLNQKILEIFNEFRVPIDGILKPMSVQSRIIKWDRKSQDNSQNAINELISDGYIGIKGNWYTLTKKGYDYLNSSYSIEDTEQVVLDFLRDKNLGVGNVILNNWITAELPKLKRYHFENFQTAFINIIDKGYVEDRNGNLSLTQKGYDKIYS